MQDEIAVKAMVPADTRAKALEVLEKVGLSLTDAINLYMVKIIEEDGIPFELKDEEFDWDSPRILHPKIDKDGGVLVPRDWLDDDD